ncbi:MAG: ABC transporter permease [Spirochaetes bacterium]|nr:ABC transporter permease [Spirochaetota bacterium]
MKRIAWNRDVFTFSRIVCALTIGFLLLPLLVLAAYSFNDSRTMSWTGFSTKWYEKLFSGSPDLWRAFRNSIVIAIGSGAVATAIGTLGAIGAARYRFRLRGYVQTIGFLPMILPEIIIGVSLSMFFAGIGLKLGLFTIFLAHVSFNLPFVFLLVSARMEEFDYSIVEAAYDLGANEIQTLTLVVLPTIMPGILSGFLTAVTLSLEDFVITFFVSGPGSTTLPLYIYSMIRYGVSPVINALSVLMIAGTALLAIPLRKFLKDFAVH